MLDNPLVTIIIPTYNRAHLIGETLDSVLVQTYENWECIIVDDGSTDNTNEVVLSYVKKDSRFQYHQRPSDQPKGGNAARNYGFEVCKGEFVNWFDDDDVMLEDFISDKISLFNSAQLNMVICTGVNVDENLIEIDKISLIVETFLFKDYVRWKLKILTPSVLFRKSFLDDKKHFDLNIHRGQEAELFSRLFYKLSESEYAILNTPLFLYRQHKRTKSSMNNVYVKLFKESQSKIAIENLKRSIEIKDLDLVRYFYIGLIHFFFRGLDNYHYENSAYILKELTPQLHKIDKQLAVKFHLIGCFFLIIKRGSYKVEKHLKKVKI